MIGREEQVLSTRNRSRHVRPGPFDIRRACRAAAWMAALSLLTFAAGRAAADDRLSEDRLKAAFLYNFAKFVEWPEAKVKTTDRLHLCVLGEDSFADEVNATVDGKIVHGKRLTVLWRHGDESRHNCHMLFIGSADDVHLPHVLDEARKAHVLTIGDTPDFIERGGMINFRMKENKVRFEINVVAAREAGLRISSQLLKLAVNRIDDLPAEK